MSLSDVIMLDVGGKLFKTYRSTLVSAPGSLFSYMFDPDSKRPPARLQENGSYFIEGSPKIFEIILHFLRYKSLMICPDISFASVRQVAIYFGLQELIDQIDVEMKPKGAIQSNRSIVDSYEKIKQILDWDDCVMSADEAGIKCTVRRKDTYDCVANVAMYLTQLQENVEVVSIERLKIENGKYNVTFEFLFKN